MSIPENVTREQLCEALKPLHDLLGTSNKNIFDGSLSINADAVTFAVPALHETVDIAANERARGVRRNDEYPSPQHMAELAFFVRVRIEDF